MSDGSLTAASPEAEGLPRFHLVMQKSRAEVYTAAFVIGFFAIRFGVMKASVVDGTIVTLIGILSAAVIWLLYKRGLGRIAGVELGWVSLWIDAILITAGVFISGGWQSPCFLFYLANAAGAAFLGGRNAAFSMATGNAVGYLAAVSRKLEEPCPYPVLGRFPTQVERIERDAVAAQTGAGVEGLEPEGFGLGRLDDFPHVD